MGLLERQSEKCAVMAGEATSKEFTSYLCFSMLLLWVCFAVLQQELKSLVFLLFACPGMNQLEQLVLPKFFPKFKLK